MIIPPFLLSLMKRPLIPWRLRNGQEVILEPEQKLAIEIADELRGLTLEGRLKGIWLHIPNEGKRSSLVGVILKAMGLHPGASDNFHLWPGDNGIIELKFGKNKLSDKQKWFFSWAEMHGIKKAVCYSKDEYLYTLRQWGALQ